MVVSEDFTPLEPDVVLDTADASQIDSLLDELQTAAGYENLAAAAEVASELREIVAGLEPAS